MSNLYKFSRFEYWDWSGVEAMDMRLRPRATAAGGTRTSPSLTPKPHPLLIPNVISEVMKRLDFGDLRSARVVCKQWAEEAVRILPSKAKICLSDFDEVAEFISKYEDSRTRFTRFKLGQNINLQEAIAQRFFNKFGSSIVFLHFDWTHWIPASLRRILFEKLPVLEELIICSQRVCENVRFLPSSDLHGLGEPNIIKLLPHIKILRVEAEFDGSSYQFVVDLISVMPNLKIASGFQSSKASSVSSAPKLSKMGMLRYEQWDNFTDLTLEDSDPDLIFSRMFNESMKSMKLSQLENLKVVLDIESINILRQDNYPLRAFEVVIPGQTFLSWHPRPTVLHNYILSLNKTLTALKLNYCSGRPKILTSFDGIGRLKNLSHLHLHRVCGTLDFLNCLPQLHSLVMTQEDYLEHYDEFHVDECRPHKLNSLKLYYTNWSASSVYSELPRAAKILNVVENITKRFPNLLSLRMETLTDKALTVIYNELPLLEELEATNGIYTSVGISGVPVINQGQSLENRKLPFVGSLKHLKKLRLESNKLTDYGIQSSVVELDKLEELTLLCYKVTDESLMAVARNLHLKVLKTEFCYELTPDAIRAATKLMKERGTKVLINPFCGQMEIEKIHDFLNENGPIHVSVPEFPVT